MEKTLALVLALTLIVTAVGVLTIADKAANVNKEDSVTVEPEPFEGENWIDGAKGTNQVTVKVDPIHVH